MAIQRSTGPAAGTYADRIHKCKPGSAKAASSAAHGSSARSVMRVARSISSAARAGAGLIAADSAENNTGWSAAVNSHCLVATSAAVPYQPDAAIGIEA